MVVLIHPINIEHVGSIIVLRVLQSVLMGLIFFFFLSSLPCDLWQLTEHFEVYKNKVTITPAPVNSSQKAKMITWKVTDARYLYLEALGWVSGLQRSPWLAEAIPVNRVSIGVTAKTPLAHSHTCLFIYRFSMVFYGQW